MKTKYLKTRHKCINTPSLIPESLLNKEKDLELKDLHQVAWANKGGQKD